MATAKDLEGVMIDGILGLFKHEDWRGQPRKSEAFPVAWLVADHVQKPGKGLEISAKDVVFMLGERPPGKDINILLRIRDRFIAVRVEVQQEDTVSQGGQVFHRFGCKYVGLKADDWDAIVRYVNDEAEPENKAHDEIAERRQKPDDAYRVIPMAVQEKLVATLVRANRLEPPAEGQVPALRMNYVGAKKNADGTKVHRVAIHSRILVGDEWKTFDTQFLVNEAGEIEQLN